MIRLVWVKRQLYPEKNILKFHYKKEIRDEGKKYLFDINEKHLLSSRFGKLFLETGDGALKGCTGKAKIIYCIAFAKSLHFKMQSIKQYSNNYSSKTEKTSKLKLLFSLKEHITFIKSIA